MTAAPMTTTTLTAIGTDMNTMTAPTLTADRLARNEARTARRRGRMAAAVAAEAATGTPSAPGLALTADDLTADHLARLRDMARTAAARGRNVYGTDADTVLADTLAHMVERRPDALADLARGQVSSDGWAVARLTMRQCVGNAVRAATAAHADTLTADQAAARAARSDLADALALARAARDEARTARAEAAEARQAADNGTGSAAVARKLARTAEALTERQAMRQAEAEAARAALTAAVEQARQAAAATGGQAADAEAADADAGRIDAGRAAAVEADGMASVVDRDQARAMVYRADLFGQAAALAAHAATGQGFQARKVKPWRKLAEATMGGSQWNSKGAVRLVREQSLATMLGTDEDAGPSLDTLTRRSADQDGPSDRAERAEALSDLFAGLTAAYLPTGRNTSSGPNLAATVAAAVRQAEALTAAGVLRRAAGLARMAERAEAAADLAGRAEAAAVAADGTADAAARKRGRSDRAEAEAAADTYRAAVELLAGAYGASRDRAAERADRLAAEARHFGRLAADLAAVTDADVRTVDDADTLARAVGRAAEARRLAEAAAVAVENMRAAAAARLAAERAAERADLADRQAERERAAWARVAAERARVTLSPVLAAAAEARQVAAAAEAAESGHVAPATLARRWQVATGTLAAEQAAAAAYRADADRLAADALARTSSLPGVTLADLVAAATDCTRGRKRAEHGRRETVGASVTAWQALAAALDLPTGDAVVKSLRASVRTAATVGRDEAAAMRATVERAAVEHRTGQAADMLAAEAATVRAVAVMLATMGHAPTVEAAEARRTVRVEQAADADTLTTWQAVEARRLALADATGWQGHGPRAAAAALLAALAAA